MVHSPVTVRLWLEVKSGLERAQKVQIWAALWMWVMASVTFLPSPMIATFPGTVNTIFFPPLLPPSLPPSFPPPLLIFWALHPSLPPSWRIEPTACGLRDQPCSCFVSRCRCRRLPRPLLLHKLLHFGALCSALGALPCFLSCEMSSYLLMAKRWPLLFPPFPPCDADEVYLRVSLVCHFVLGFLRTWSVVLE